MRKDDSQQISDLRRIIELGKKLKKDTRPDQKKLDLLLNKIPKKITTTQAKSVQTTTNKSTNKTINNDSNILFSIKSVYSKDNSIIVEFNVDISQKDINFFELKPSPLYRDIFDIKGYFKDALATKLAIKSNEKITIGQFKPDVLRVVVSGEKNPNTSYTLVNSRKLIINIDSSKVVAQSNKATTISQKEQKQEDTTIVESQSNTLIDSDNEIRSIESIDNKIVVKFNKNFTKNDLIYKAYKQGRNFEQTFDIKGKYKYTNPLKLSLNNIDKVITTEHSNRTRIRLINSNNPKVVYAINNKELVITSLGKATKTSKTTTTNSSSKASQAVQKVVIDKTIVIDPGHGGSDAGAVGPNKRYEKVINLAVAKYLENILKQRGYKVFLTRTNDKFIKVMDRTVLANEKNADLFLSIHTNAMPKEKANSTSGIETFFLSPARSERAKRVAALENKDDIREMSESSKNVFLESLNRPRITASHKFAIDVQAGLLQASRTKYKDVKDVGVKEGPFWVLVGAQMPSILIELGFISHPEESRRLYQKDYQQLLANGIANGIDSYFLKNP